MKDGVKNILGRRITGVVAKMDRGYSQVFLVFEDGTHYEFWAHQEIHGCGGVDPGGFEEVLKFENPNSPTVFAEKLGS